MAWVLLGLKWMAGGWCLRLMLDLVKSVQRPVLIDVVDILMCGN
jgi:hypothetical protein